MMMGSEYHRFGSHKPRVRMARYEITKEAWMKTPAASICVKPQGPSRSPDEPRGRKQQQ